MSNEKERATARRNYENAEAEMWRIEDLPQEVGATVTWKNGVVWTRRGDDDWVTDDPRIAFPSAHIAMKGMWK